MSAYTLELDHREFATLVEALAMHATTLHDIAKAAKAAQWHDTASTVYADALRVETLQYRLEHMPSLDDVLRMLNGAAARGE